MKPIFIKLYFTFFRLRHDHRLRTTVLDCSLSKTDLNMKYSDVEPTHRPDSRGLVVNVVLSKPQINIVTTDLCFLNSLLWEHKTIFAGSTADHLQLNNRPP